MNIEEWKKQYIDKLVSITGLEKDLASEDCEAWIEMYPEAMTEENPEDCATESADAWGQE